MHKKKFNGVLFKIDFEKTYGKVKWDFLQERGSPIWCNWIQGLVQGGNVGIKVKDQLGLYLQERAQTR